MPIYEYQCDECGQRLEVMQRISEPPRTDCPECGESGLRKLVSAAGFVLKGTGWYATDFKDKPKAKSTGGKSGEEAPADKAADKDSGEKSNAEPAAAGSGNGADPKAGAAAPASAPKTGSAE